VSDPDVNSVRRMILPIRQPASEPFRTVARHQPVARIWQRHVISMYVCRISAALVGNQMPVISFIFARFAEERDRFWCTPRGGFNRCTLRETLVTVPIFHTRRCGQHDVRSLRRFGTDPARPRILRLQTIRASRICADNPERVEIAASIDRYSCYIARQ